MKNTVCKILFTISLVLLLWTASACVPFYFRDFYFMQMDSLGICEEAGKTPQQVKDAYNDMLDFLVFNKDFKLGDFEYTEDAKAHFQDVKALFGGILIVMLVSFIVVVTLLILQMKKKISLKMWGFHAGFYASIFAITLPCVILAFSAINFRAAGEFFHYILFPGKSNWVFYPSQDPIIKILPVQFFVNCAILIVCVLLFLAAIVIICSIISKIKAQKKAKT